jgi:hypothetical protein
MSVPSYTKIIKNRDSLLKNLLSVLIIFAIFFVEGCFNFLELKFSFERVKEITFWISIGTRCTLMILVKSLAMLIFLDIARRKNENLTIEKTKNERLMKLKDADFPVWVEAVKNIEISIEAWKLKINKKLIRLEKFSKQSDRALYYKSKSDPSIDISTNRYCIKRQALEYLISDDYINQNLNCLNVKCQRIDAAGFNIPVNIKHIGDKYQIFAKTKSAIAGSLFIASSWLFVMQIIKEAMAFDWAESIPLAVIVGLLLDLVFLIYQFFMGIIDSFKLIDEQEVLPYANRNRILEEYLYYKQPDKKDKIDQLLIKLETVERT